jgi:hypothetical protein
MLDTENRIRSLGTTTDSVTWIWKAWSRSELEKH